MDALLNQHLKEGLFNPDLVTLQLQTTKGDDEGAIIEYLTYSVELGKTDDNDWEDLLHDGQYLKENTEEDEIIEQEQRVFASVVHDALGIDPE